MDTDLAGNLDAFNPAELLPAALTACMIKVALTAHLVVTDTEVDTTGLLAKAQEELDEHFEIEHVTLQVERSDFARHCTLLSHTSHID